MSRSRRSRSSDRSQRDQRELAWRRIDLHIHTPASADYQEPDVSYLDILRKAEARGADLIAFTDHNSVRGYANLWREIEDLELLEALQRLSPTEQRRLDEYRRLLHRIRVLPGFEFTATFGFHILAIFPEGTSIRHIEHTLLELNIAEDKVDLGTGEVGATTDVLRAYEVIHEAGAMVIPAHVNSTHGVAMVHLPFGGQTKIAFTQSPLIAALEATDLESTSRRTTARFFNGSKPEYPRRMHVIQGSDAHRLNRDPNRETNLGVCDRMTEVYVPEISWAALRDLFATDFFNRVRPCRPAQDEPYDFVRAARAEGETIVQTFHHQLPPRRGRQSAIVRDAAAFANANGGTIFVGLSANPSEPILGVAEAHAQAREIAEDLARYIAPPVPGTVEIHTTEGKSIVVITIPPGEDKPYAVEPGMIFLRQERETTPALRDEIVQLVRGNGVAIGNGVSTPAPTGPRLTIDLGPTIPAPVLPSPPEVEAHEEEPLGEALATAPSGSSRRRRRGGRGRGRGGAQPPDTMDLVENGAEHDAVLAEHPVASPEPAGYEPEDAAPATDETVAEMSAGGATEELVLPDCHDIPYPRTGVEIVASQPREGMTYHAMRDLRNLKVVHNVTRTSARRLWRYAISQWEQHPVDADDVHWGPDPTRGFWKAYKPRGGDVRFNLVYRHGDHLHVFYGVTDEGLDDGWRDAIPPDKLPHVAPEDESPESAASAIAEATAPVLIAESEPEPEPIVAEAPQLPEPPAAATVEPAIAPEGVAVATNAPGEEPAPKPRRRRAPAKPKTQPAEPVEIVATEAELAAPVSEPPAVEPAVPILVEAEVTAAEPVVETPAPKRRAPRRKKTEPAVEPEAAPAAEPEIVAALPEPEPAAEPAPAPKRRAPRRRKVEPADTTPAEQPETEG